MPLRESARSPLSEDENKSFVPPEERTKLPGADGHAHSASHTRPEDQEIGFRVVGRTTIVDLPPQVRRAVAEKLGSLLDFIVRSHPPRLILNFKRVERIESSGIAACLFAHRECQGATHLGIFGISPSVMRLFTIARIDNFFHFYADETEALAG